MSLNGLENRDVQDAYQAALTEAGGWLLLKYASRDSVELLGRGKGGVSEARTAIARYEEKSPVYGVIVYRRRKVLIKYIPEGTSRVLLARTAVHFQDVQEKFSPYEALLEITAAEGLNDTSLAASFPLHTATPSASSTRLRLDEITEDGEDPGPPRESPATRVPTGSYFASQRYRLDRRADTRTFSERSPTQLVDPVKGGARPTSPLSSNLPSPVKTSVSQFLVRSDSGKPSITSLGSNTAASIAEYAPSEASTHEARSSVSTVGTSKPTLPATESSHTEPSTLSRETSFTESSIGVSGRGVNADLQPRSSTSQSIDGNGISSYRPSTSQSNYENDLLDFLKPKVKLGPRPVTASERAKRPAVASVSSLPATYRLSMRKQEPSKQNPPPLMNKPLPTPPPIPESSDYNPRPLSRGSVKSMQSTKSTAMTPDKLRLMKAVELRRKQLRKSNPQPAVTPVEEPVPDVPKVPAPSPIQEEKSPESQPVETTPALQRLKASRVDAVASSDKADSGIGMGYEKHDKHESAENNDTAALQQSQRVPPDSAKLHVEIARTPLPPPPESPRFAMPGSFSNPCSPDRTVEPTLDPDIHLSDDHYPPKESADDLAIADTANEITNLPEGNIAVPAIVTSGDPQRPTSDTGQQAAEYDAKSLASDVVNRSGHESAASSNGLATAWEQSPRRKNSDLARRRQGYVEPMHVESDIESSGDEFMDEIHDAQVEEARPIMVSRTASSPVEEFLQRRPSERRPSGRSELDDQIVTPTGVVESSPLPSADITPKLAPRVVDVKRDQPETYRPTAPTLDGAELPTSSRRTVSSEISKRIQALAGTTNRENGFSSPSSRPLTPDTSSNSILSPNRSPAHSRNKSFNAFTKYTSRANQNPHQTNSMSPLPPQTVYSVQHDPTTTRESVSVTARIVRPQPVEQEEPVEGVEPEFHQSQLIINHKRGTSGTSSRTALPQLERIDTKSEAPPAAKQEPMSPSDTTSPNLSLISNEIPRIAPPSLPESVAASPALDGRQASTSSLSPSARSPTFNYENLVPKDSGSRTSRFFKRMSHIGGKRRSGVHQLSEGTNLASAVAKAPSKDRVEVRSIMLPAVTVGDLNIQFPDSLLWKRRIVAIDDAGAVRLQPTENQKASPRQYQLADFKMPYVPDQDRQELPNSIMLDFRDGTSLQIACEDSVTHLQVSHVLKTYWKAWARSV